MLSFIAALVLLASVGASRIQVHEFDEEKFEAKRSFQAPPCDELQTIFSGRVSGFQVSFDSIESLETVGRFSQARLLVRVYGIVRTLRRARTCSWVTDDDTDDIEQVRDIVQRLLAGNPCSEVARSELEAGRNATTFDDEIRSIQRSIWVLTSDTCEVVEPPVVHERDHLDEREHEDEVRDAEDQVQDALDELAHPSEESESALIQTDSQGFVRRLFRVIGVILLLLFLALACTGALAFIGAVLGLLAGEFLWRHLGHPGFTGMDASLYGLISLNYGAAAGTLFGFAGCAYQVFTHILPRLTESAESAPAPAPAP